jgi:prepilin-type N-terminal cleavage/methylation domain-containing protein
MKRHAGGSAGFTLIELLVVAAILAVATAAVVGCLAAGIRVWEAASGFAADENEAMFALRTVQKDLMNAGPFYAVRVSGGPAELCLPVEMGVAAEGGGEQRRIGTVEYFADASRRGLFRRAWPFPGEEMPRRDAERVAAQVDGVALSYWGPAGDGRAAGWRDRWENPTNLPSRVRVELLYRSGGATRTFSRVFPLPRGVAEE